MSAVITRDKAGKFASASSAKTATVTAVATEASVYSKSKRVVAAYYTGLGLPRAYFYDDADVALVEKYLTECRVGDIVNYNKETLHTTIPFFNLTPNEEEPVGFVRANLLQALTRPCVANVVSCHALDNRNRGSNRCGGQLGYFTNPNWTTVFLYTRVDEQASWHIEHRGFMPITTGELNMVNPVASVNICLGFLAQEGLTTITPAVLVSQPYGNSEVVKKSFHRLYKWLMNNVASTIVCPNRARVVYTGMGNAAPTHEQHEEMPGEARFYSYPLPPQFYLQKHGEEIRKAEPFSMQILPSRYTDIVLPQYAYQADNMTLDTVYEAHNVDKIPSTFYMGSQTSKVTHSRLSTHTFRGYDNWTANREAKMGNKNRLYSAQYIARYNCGERGVLGPA